MNKQENKSLETRKLIIDKSIELISRDGLHDLSLAKIITATNLSKGGFYHHFKSKDQLLHTIVDEIIDSILRIPYETFDNSSLYNFYVDYISYMGSVSNTEMKDINYSKIIFEATNQISGFTEKVEELKEESIDNWAQIVKKAKQTGEVNSSLDADFISNMFIETSRVLNTTDNVSENNIKMITEIWNGIYSNITKKG